MKWMNFSLQQNKMLQSRTMEGMFMCISGSDALQQIGTLWVLQPACRPRGLDAGSVLQTVVVSCQFRITLLAQSASKKKINVRNRQMIALVHFNQDPLTHNGRDSWSWGKDRHQPTWKRFLPGSRLSPTRQNQKKTWHESLHVPFLSQVDGCS